MVKRKVTGEKVAKRAAWAEIPPKMRSKVRGMVRDAAERMSRYLKSYPSAGLAERRVWSRKLTALRAALALLSEPAPPSPGKRGGASS